VTTYRCSSHLPSASAPSEGGRICRVVCLKGKALETNGLSRKNRDTSSAASFALDPSQYFINGLRTRRSEILIIRSGELRVHRNARPAAARSCRAARPRPATNSRRCLRDGAPALHLVMNSWKRAPGLVTTIYHMLKDGTQFQDLGGDHFDRRSKEVRAKRLVTQLAKLSFDASSRALPKWPEIVAMLQSKRRSSRHLNHVCGSAGSVWRDRASLDARTGCGRPEWRSG
jgi:hypothetical protein